MIDDFLLSTSNLLSEFGKYVREVYALRSTAVKLNETNAYIMTDIILDTYKIIMLFLFIMFKTEFAEILSVLYRCFTKFEKYVGIRNILF